MIGRFIEVQLVECLLFHVSLHAESKQLVRFGWHVEGLLLTSNIENAEHHDEGWNLASSMSGLQSGLRTAYFEDFIYQSKRTSRICGVPRTVHPMPISLDVVRTRGAMLSFNVPQLIEHSQSDEPTPFRLTPRLGNIQESKMADKLEMFLKI